ncbi:DegV family protein [Georgenia thermotolerans]|uniref:DegV family EDD domain-containing protein n=1 Tax=Georgenia thermotolerans TaxID=527326 RepID=A0A7J5UJ18_9MICO|nr:DegV family protein [Georgenia thermotolerans]KAE8762144.1 DegV family EDD domain-containing protein [Georgenia thermotolerans]
MNPDVAVVTDSTASLPARVAAAHGIGVVPLHVVVGGEDRLDDAASSAELVDRMRAGAAVTTSQPSVGELVEAFRAAGDGRRDVVSLHLSGELSGTVGTARRAAALLAAEGRRVHVLDTRTVAGGTGLAALAAAEAAGAGRPVDQVVAVARETAAKAQVLFAVPELGWLQRGGRIGAGAALVGSALGIRPVLGIADGRIAVVETVRGLARARRRVVARAVQAAGGPGARVPHPPAVRVRLAVHHFGDAADARELQDQLAEALAGTGALVAETLRSELTAVVGAHTGPGVLGVVIAPAG